MKRIIIALTLAAIVGVVSCAPTPTQQDPMSPALAQWRHSTGYTGPVCLTSPHSQLDTHGLVKCDNAAPANPATLNAGRAFEAWYYCRAGEKFACTFLNDR